MTNTETPQNYVAFADGSLKLLPSRLAARVVGLDADGDLLVPLMDEMPDYLVPLTSCCNASGKGSSVSTGVVCRSCYRVVSPKYGGSEDCEIARV